jgi:hypothetical protein
MKGRTIEYAIIVTIILAAAAVARAPSNRPPPFGDNAFAECSK